MLESNKMNERMEERFKKAIDFLKVIKEAELSDELYPTAYTFQRRFRIGIETAKKIVERLEKEGYISKFDGHTPRKVLKTNQ